MRKGLKLLVALISLGLWMTLAFAVSSASSGSETKGRFFFRKTCKTCHTKGAAGSEITPLSKTQTQWKAYFTAAKHAKGKEQLIKLMSAEELVDVATYLQAHASDSPQPETCGK
ncbi:MAG: cytochrome c [Acidobacteriia bacterium]|nr:cytochrome c [Terriglobia bacterium]